MEVYVVFSFLLVFSTSMTSGQNVYFPNDVISPNNCTGKCDIVDNCPHVVNLLKTKGITPETRDFLRKYQCGWEGNNVKICCENTNLANHSRSIGVNDNECGIGPPKRRRGRILGGNQAKSNEFPWMALLIYDINESTPGYLCGGSIINSRYILTAAHCVTNLPAGRRLIGVVVGMYDMIHYQECSAKRNCDGQYQEFTIEKVIPHSGYSTPKIYDDIALIKLDGEINFISNNVRTICLPVGLQAAIPNTFTLSGWGLTELRVQSFVLQKIELNRFPQKDCASAYAKQNYEIWDKQICAGGLQGKSGCSGDSGGPLQAEHFYNNEYRTVQYGIVSFGTRTCGVAGYPGVFTRIDYYLDWILKNLRNLYLEGFMKS